VGECCNSSYFRTKKRRLMSPAKIVRIVGVVLAIAVALVPAIPEGALLLSVAGLVVGYYVAAGNRANLFLMVIVLASGAADAAGAIPGIGGYISDILGSLTSLLAAACITVIAMIIKERLSE
jgi:hypothetical protein